MNDSAVGDVAAMTRGDDARWQAHAARVQVEPRLNLSDAPPFARLVSAIKALEQAYPVRVSLLRRVPPARLPLPATIYPLVRLPGTRN
ncbi:MAG: hypothetical protein R3C56_08910 [Pirellulaceae bacterium]